MCLTFLATPTNHCKTARILLNGIQVDHIKINCDFCVWFYHLKFGTPHFGDE